MSVDDIQHGGDHYKKGGAMQHWNMLLLVGFGWEYYIGAATKYTSRYMKKRGAEDVQKAIHFVDKLVDAIERGQVPTTFRTAQGFRMNLDAQPATYDQTVNVEQLVKDYCVANDIKDLAAITALQRLFSARSVGDLMSARVSLVTLHDSLTGYTEPEVAAPTGAARVASVTDAASAALGAEAGPAYVGQDPDEPKPKRAASRRKTAKPE